MREYSKSKSDQLLKELKVDPAAFRRQPGAASSLLWQFQRGLPLSHLQELLTSEDDDLLSSAVFIMSELGQDAVLEFVDAAIRLSDHTDPRVRHATNEILVRTTDRIRHKEFMHVMKHMDDAHPYVRRMALSFFARASRTQLSSAASEWAISRLSKAPIHADAARLALSDPSPNKTYINGLVNSQDRLQAYYGLGLAARQLESDPSLSEILLHAEGTELTETASHLLDWINSWKRLRR